MQLRKKSIIAVDQSMINLRLLSVILEKEGFSLKTSQSGLDAFPMIVETKPDLILLDMVLPGIDGVELCRMLKANSETEHIPVIIITAKTRGADVFRSLESGAFDFIKKPIDELEVIARVRSAIRYREYQEQLLEMAMRDSLTGLYNHALIVDLLEKEIYNSKRKNRPLTFVMADIDHFKNINDNFGHIAGDAVLVSTSRLLENTLRKGDYLGRYGGEEFALILSGLEQENAFPLCDRLRLLVEGGVVPFDDKNIRVTISMGAIYIDPGKEISAAAAVQEADAALYRAKEEGRNKVIFV